MGLGVQGVQGMQGVQVCKGSKGYMGAGDTRDAWGVGVQGV